MPSFYELNMALLSFHKSQLSLLLPSWQRFRRYPLQSISIRVFMLQKRLDMLIQQGLRKQETEACRLCPGIMY